MTQIKDERGYAALVAIMVILVLTLLGTNLLQVTLGSLIMARKTESRGESQYYARMGMEEAIARLHKAVEQINAEIGSSSETAPIDSAHLYKHLYIPIMNRHFPVNAFPKTYTAPDNRGSYEISFTREPKKPASESTADTELANPNTPIVEKFTFTVTGTAPSAHGTETTKMKASIYVSTIPEEFHYVLSTPVDETSECQSDPNHCASIILNGSPYIQGDIYSNTFKMNDEATYYTNSRAVQVQTTYPSVIGQLGGKYVKENHLFKDDTPFIPDVTNISSTWYQSFVIPPSINLNLAPAFGNIRKISDVIAEKRPNFGPSNSAETEYDGDEDGTVDNLVTITSTTTNGGVKIKENVTDFTVINGDFSVNGVLTMDGTDTTLNVPNGNLLIAGNKKDDAIHNQAAYLRGEVDVGDGHYIFIDGNAVFEDLTCNETIYVNGDLRVQGSFTMNATVYVKGNVEFTEENTSDGNNPGTLVILAGGTVELFNLSMTNTLKEISTFIYSEADNGITLYGVGSNYKLYGGIHAKKIELNAVRGEVLLDKNRKPMLDASGNVLFESSKGPLNPDPKSSRLHVQFNPNIFENPPPGIPIKHKFSYYIHEFATLNNP
jgi:hypothetical protein